MSSISRNSQCPCGSGKKYKQCCLGQEEPATSPLGRLARQRLRTERPLAQDIMAWAEGTYGDSWMAAGLHGAAAVEPVDPEELALMVPWLLYQLPHGLQPPAAAFLAQRGTRLSEFERTTLQANLAGRLSLWEVHRVEPGVGLELHDRLSQETRFVHDVSCSRSAQRWMTFLAIVVDYGDVTAFGGLHPRPLMPVESTDVIAGIRRFLRVRTKSLPAKRMQTPEAQLAMIVEWRFAVGEQDRRRMEPRVMQNTDGDPLVLCTDHFHVAEADRPTILESLATLEDSHLDEHEDGDVVSFSRPGNQLHAGWDNTLVGRARMQAGLLLLETNSVKRADALRKRVERLAGTRIKHQRREKRSAESMMREAQADPAPRVARPEPPAEIRAAMREMLERHYLTWLDTALPAFGGRTPREAAASATLRPQLVAMLKEFEIEDRRKPEYERHDFGRTWAALGLDPVSDSAAAPRRGVSVAPSKPIATNARPWGAIDVLELMVTLRDVEPRIWRRLRVRANITLPAFHDVLQRVMGWTDSHLHLFRAGGIEYGVRDDELPQIRSEKSVRLGTLLLKPGDRLVYEYDFGDSWEHDIELLRVLPPDPGPGKYPFVLEGARACPPEDCGGVPGYEDLLRVLADRRDPEHKNTQRWVGGAFDPEAFEASAINGLFHRTWVLPEEPPPIGRRTLHKREPD